MRSLLPLFAFLSLFGLAACDTLDGGSDFRPEVVVESYLAAGEMLAPVRLSRTAPVGATYDFTALAIRDAAVEVQRLGADGSVEKRYPYRARPNDAGVYFPERAEPVEPLRRYRLIATVPGEAEPVTATTLVPGRFALVGASADTIVYQSTEQLEFVVTRSQYPGRQSYYLLSTRALDAREATLTPFARSLYDSGVSLQDLSAGSSPILNEQNYPVNPDGTVTIRLPWLGVSFYGTNVFIANAIDDNLYDFLRSSGVQQGGSTFSPGEIPDVLDRVENGRGIFGSYARVEYTIVVLPPRP